MVMAKGVEDCAFYRWSRLTSLNEVGGDPSEFAIAVDEFHEAMAARQADWPHAMTTLSTHDTKRGEDVRARITVLAEIPHVWEAHLDELLTLAPVPDPGFGSLLWQAILGAWPASRERLHGYAEKAMREAGDRTTWTEPDGPTRRPCTPPSTRPSTTSRYAAVLAELLAHVVAPGWSNSPRRRSWSRSRCRACPTSTRAASCGSRAWSTRTTGARSTSTSGPTCSSAVRDGAGLPLTDSEDDPGGAKLPGHPPGADPAPRPARAVHGVHAGQRDRGRRPTTCWPSTAAARSPSPPGCRSGSTGAAAGATPSSSCRTGPGATCSPTAPPASALADLLETYPVALLVRDERMTGADPSTCGRRARPASGCRWRGVIVEMQQTTAAGGRRRSPRPIREGRGRLRLPDRRRGLAACPTHGPGVSRRASTSAREPTTRARSRGPTPAGPAASSRGR